MNKKNALICVIIFIFIIYLSILIYISFAILLKKESIKEKHLKIQQLERNILKEKTSVLDYSIINKNFLNDPYFGNNKNDFEQYIRNILYRNKILYKVYHSKYSESGLDEIEFFFRADSLTFFKILKEIEFGDKLTIIEQLSINASLGTIFEIRMKIRGKKNANKA